MTTPEVPPPPSDHALSVRDTHEIAAAARELAIRFAAAADGVAMEPTPDKLGFAPIVVFTALQVFTASLLMDHVPPENHNAVLDVLSNGVLHRLDELKEIIAEFDKSVEEATRGTV